MRTGHVSLTTGTVLGDFDVSELPGTFRSSSSSDTSVNLPVQNVIDDTIRYIPYSNKLVFAYMYRFSELCIALSFLGQFGD